MLVDIGTDGLRTELPANGDPLANDVKAGKTGGIAAEQLKANDDRFGLPRFPLSEESPANPGFNELDRLGPDGKTWLSTGGNPREP